MTAAPPPSRSGCLTAEEVALLHGAPAGEVPEGLARHLASCVRCQERALFGGVRARKRREASLLPTPTRALLLLGIMVAIIVAFFFTLQRLVGAL